MYTHPTRGCRWTMMLEATLCCIATVANSATPDAPVSTEPKPVKSELAPDKDCTEPEENFSLSDKLLQYGGTEAQLRLKRIITSNFKFTDLTSEDKQMLAYLARTTVWVPVEVEQFVAGRYYASYHKQATDYYAEDVDAVAAMQRRMENVLQIKEGLKNYPGKLSVLFTLPNDRNGLRSLNDGTILIQTPEVDAMLDERQDVARLMLSHEMAHLYKRHTIKEAQFLMVSSETGFKLAKGLLARLDKNDKRNGSDLERNAAAGLLSTCLVADNPIEKLKCVPVLAGWAKLGKEVFDFMGTVRINFGELQELEADACTIHVAKALNWNADELWRALGSLNKGASGSAKVYLANHPSPEERIAHIERATRLQNAPSPKAKPPSKPRKKSQSKQPAK